jgi:hypothetical protein
MVIITPSCRGLIILSTDYAIKIKWEKYSTPVDWSQIINAIMEMPSSICEIKTQDYSGKIWITTTLPDGIFRTHILNDFEGAGLI